MSSKGAWSSIAILLALALAQATPAQAQSASGAWDLLLTVKVKGPGGKGTFSETGMLILNSDRTYTLETDGDPLVEEGVWFQDGKQVFIYSTNLLELVTAIEDELSVELGEPVDVVPLRSSAKCVLNPKTGLLSLKSKQLIKVVGQVSGTTAKLGAASKATGTRTVP